MTEGDKQVKEALIAFLKWNGHRAAYRTADGGNAIGEILRSIMAQDRDVQARVLRAYAKEVDTDLWPHEVTHGDYARGIADDIVKGEITLEVEEEK